MELASYGKSMCVPNDQLIERSLRQLDSPVAQDRSEALKAIYAAKEVNSKGLLPQLAVRLQREECANVRVLYCGFFAEFLPGNGDAARLLLATFKQDLSCRVRQAITRSIYDLRRSGAKCMAGDRTWEILKEILLLALRDDNNEVRNDATRALGALAFRGPDIEDALALSLSDTDASVRECAAEGLASVGVASSRTMCALLSAATPSAAKALAIAPSGLLADIVPQLHVILDR